MFKLEFSEQEVNLLLNALIEMPYRISHHMVSKIQIQCSKQIEEKKREVQNTKREKQK